MQARMRAYFVSTHGRPHACLGPLWAWLAGAAYPGDRLTWQPAGTWAGDPAGQPAKGACAGGEGANGVLVNGAAGDPYRAQSGLRQAGGRPRHIARARLH